MPRRTIASTIGSVGSLGCSLIGTYVDEFLTEPLPGATEVRLRRTATARCAARRSRSGATSCARTGRRPWGVDLSLTWRYIDAVDVDGTSSDPA